MKTLAALLLLIAGAAQAHSAAPSTSNPGVPWPATDALGRKLPLAAEVGPPRAGRFVGMFYFLWHNMHHVKSTLGEGPNDITRILAAKPDALNSSDSPLWGPLGTAHYWGQPLYGYYRADDPWVLRRHAQLLADAGVDTLLFDTTNGETFKDAYFKLCEVFAQVRRDGGRTPQIAFMVNTRARETAERLFADLYQPGFYRELWFQWQRKPLLLCDPAQASPALGDFFTLRAAHWPFTMQNTRDAWHWEATYPQPFGFADDPKQPEQMSVSVAQNLRASDGRVTNMSLQDARGRGFHDGQSDRSLAAIARGANFEEQWKRARQLEPPFVLVTGWNEWVAGRFGQPGGPVTFVDQFDEEFSRDIEPMLGGHGDNFYYQLVANVRRYKGTADLPKATGSKSIHIDGGFEQWNDVGPEFSGHVDEAQPRDHDGAAGLHYANRTGRNDLAVAKVARDDENVYFYIRTRSPISPRTDPNWMWLLIDVHGDGEPPAEKGTVPFHSADSTKGDSPRRFDGWEGFDYIVNRTVADGGDTWLEKSTGGWQWQKVAKLRYRMAGSEMHLAIPRSALGLPAGAKPISLDFKWADNLQRPGDVQDFYLSGSVAPAGRFRYRYNAP